MPKQTRLNDSAEIYQPREKLSEREKLRGMTFKEKIDYLWEYYKIHALITIVAVVSIAYIIYTIVTPKIEPQLYVAVVDNPVEPTILEEFEAQFAEYLQIDPEKEEVMINPQFYFHGDSEYAANMRQVLVTYVAAQDVDIIIAPKSEFDSYSYYGYMYSLSDLLPTDLYSKLSENFYIGVQEDNPEEKVYGIYLNEAALFKDNERISADNPYILGVIGNARRTDNAVEFIRYLFR